VARTRAVADRDMFRARSLTGELSVARETIANLQRSVAALQVEVAGLERGNTELARKLESAERLGAHALDDLKARYRRVFRAEMSPVAGDAKASLEIAPPRPEFAVDYLATLISIIDKELTWLDEPSE
jgi:predicted  nucleic acid-binding Zn-ribbon protein